MGSFELQIDCEIILNSWHNTAYEFQEYEEALSHLRLATISLYGFDNCFHHLSMVARMNARLLHIDMRVLLHSHSLLRVVGCDVLKYLGLT